MCVACIDLTYTAPAILSKHTCCLIPYAFPFHINAYPQPTLLIPSRHNLTDAYFGSLSSLDQNVPHSLLTLYRLYGFMTNSSTRTHKHTLGRVCLVPPPPPHTSSLYPTLYNPLNATANALPARNRNIHLYSP